MKPIRIALLALILTVGAFSFSGCQLFSPNVTAEAKAYLTLQDTWLTGHKAYQVWLDKVAQGKVTKQKELQVDNAYILFRNSVKTMAKVAQSGWKEAPTPDETKKLLDNLLKLIKSL